MEVSLEWIYSCLRLSRTARGSPLPRLLWMNSTRFPSTPVCVPLLGVQPLVPLYKLNPLPFQALSALSIATYLPSSHQAGKHLSYLLSPTQYPHRPRNALGPVFSSSHRVTPALLRPAQTFTLHTFLGELSSTWSLSSLKAGAFLSGSLPRPVFKKKKKEKMNARGARQRERRGRRRKVLKVELMRSDWPDTTPGPTAKTIRCEPVLTVVKKNQRTKSYCCMITRSFCLGRREEIFMW